MSSYATPQDLNLYGLPIKALESLITSDIQAQLDAASDFIDGYFAERFTLPLVAPFPVSLVQKTCQIAQWELLAVRGFNPENGSHVTVRQRYEDAVSWCKDVSGARVTPQVKDSSSGERGGPYAVQASSDSSTGVVVASTPKLRGWR